MKSIILALALALSGGAAEAHHFYDWACCSDRDCAPLPDGVVKPTKGGWLFVPTGAVIAYDDKRIKPSPDSRFHGCFVGGDPKGRLLCLYVPAQGV